MLLYKLAQEKLLNFILLISLTLVWYIVKNNFSSAGYEIVKNISYSVIASIIFYYINGIYFSVKKDRYARSFLISQFKNVQQDLLVYIFLCMPDRDHGSNLKYKDLENPIFFKNYFKYLRCGFNGNTPWSSYPYHQDTEVENIKKMFLSISQFNELIQRHRHELFLSQEAKDFFDGFNRDLSEYKYYPDSIFLIINDITHAESWRFDKEFNESPQLFYLRPENYTIHKWEYFKSYSIAAYLIFWTFFALNTIT